MAKTCPSCGYRPIGPFTDNCPICAEPVRNIRSDGAGPGNSSAWLWWTLRGGVVLVLGVAGCCGLGMWRMGSAIQEGQRAMIEMQSKMEADRKARTVVVNAANLLQEFEQDAAAAEQKYKGKYLELTGFMERRGKTGNGASFIILNGGDEDAQLKIECFFDFVREEDDVPIGQLVTVRGEYGGRVSHVQVRGCVLAPNAPG